MQADSCYRVSILVLPALNGIFCREEIACFLSRFWLQRHEKQAQGVTLCVHSRTKCPICLYQSRSGLHRYVCQDAAKRVEADAALAAAAAVAAITSTTRAPLSALAEDPEEEEEEDGAFLLARNPSIKWYSPKKAQMGAKNRGTLCRKVQFTERKTFCT